MTRLGALVAAVLAASSLAAPAAVAVSGPSVLTVTGRGGTYVDVVVPTSSARPWHSLSVSGGKSFAGLCVRGVTARSEIGCAVWLRDLPSPSDEVGFGTYGDALPAGRLRLYLVGDGPVKARLAVSGLRRSLSVTTRHAVRTDVRTGDVAAVPGAPVGESRVAFDRRPATVVAVGVRWRADAPAGATNGFACVTVAGGECAAEESAHSSQSVHWESGWVGEFATFYGNGALGASPATLEAVVQTQHADLVSAARSFVVVVDA